MRHGRIICWDDNAYWLPVGCKAGILLLHSPNVSRNRIRRGRNDGRGTKNGDKDELAIVPWVILGVILNRTRVGVVLLPGSFWPRGTYVRLTGATGL